MKEINPMLLAGALVAVAASSSLSAENTLFSLQWIPNGNNFGVFAAKEEGFYRESDRPEIIRRQGNPEGDGGSFLLNPCSQPFACVKSSE